ncbi:MAG: hypothetical protein DCC57_04370 [Chloroflexi bacterium]|nr:MAG: hypothetical protein DCC57_04370 [Chloroflexota bacterium]
MDLFIRQLVDAWNSHDFDQITLLYDADYRGYDVALARPQQGIADLHYTLAVYWQAFPDLHFTAEQFVFDGEQLALFWRATGTHRGTFLHIPATGHTIEVHGAAHHRLRNRKIVQSLYVWDTAGLLRSLKLLPELST